MFKNCMDAPPNALVASSTVNHALKSKRGGFFIIRSNSMIDFEGNFIKQVHNDVEVEPHLQPINVEKINGLTGDNARPNIRARSILCMHSLIFVLQTLMKTLSGSSVTNQNSRTT